MKKTIKLLGIFALIALIGFAMAACGDGGGGGGRTVTYKGTAPNGDIYSLKIIENENNRAVLDDPMPGDGYELTVGAKKSTGAVQAFTSNKFTLKPKYAGAAAFDATVSGSNGLTDVTGFITFDDGDIVQGPGAVTPGTPPSSGSGKMTWTAVANTTFGSSGIESDINAIAYGNGKFVAGGNGGKMATSADGITWTAVDVTSIFDDASWYGIEAIAYGNNKFVAVGGLSKMATSPDGTTWTEVYGVDDISCSAIAYGNGKFVAAGSGEMWTSPDGITWTAVGDSTIWDYTEFGITLPATIFAIAYGNNMFVAGGEGGKMAYSPDGISWTAVADSTIWDYEFYSSTRTASIYDIAYGNNTFVAVSEEGKIATSTNGATWTAVTNNPFVFTDYVVDAYDISVVGFGNGMFVAGTGFVGSAISTSTDGRTWAALTDLRSDIYAQGNAIAYGGGRFVIVCDRGKMVYSSEGSGSNPGNPSNPSNPSNPGGSGGTLTITGIPAKYNGSYAACGFVQPDLMLAVAGCQSVNTQGETITSVTYPRISNGSVTLSLYVIEYDDEGDFERFEGRYSGNDTMNGSLTIHNKATVANADDADDLDPIAVCSWRSVPFSNGSAAVTWSSADNVYEF